MAIPELREALVRLAGETPIVEQRLNAAAAALTEKREADIGSVRDWITVIGSCTEVELAIEFMVTEEQAAELLGELAQREIVRGVRGPWGRRWVYLPPDEDAEFRSRPRRTPPEKMPPAMVESMATGAPVRVAAMARLTRQGRSTGGLAHFHRMRDKRYEEMQKAKEAAAQASKTKAQKQPKWKRKK